MTFDEEITVQRGVRQAGGSGEFSDFLTDIPANVRELRGREIVTGGSAEATLADTLFTVRWRDDIRINDRIVHGGRSYDIQRLRDGRGRRINLEIEARSIQ